MTQVMLFAVLLTIWSEDGTCHKAGEDKSLFMFFLRFALCAESRKMHSVPLKTSLEHMHSHASLAHGRRCLSPSSGWSSLQVVRKRQGASAKTTTAAPAWISCTWTGKEGRMNPMDILTPAGMARLARTDRFLVHFDIGNATTVFQTSVACLGFAGCNHRSLKTDVTWFSLGWPYQRSSWGTTRTDGFATSVSNAAPGATSILAQVADQSAAASGTSTMSPSSRAT